MIYIGNSEISIMLGNTEIPAIYCGNLQIYPMNFGTVTGISLEDLTWVTDISSSGGTATSANCTFNVYAEYDSGKRKRVTNYATVTGSTVIPSTTAETREMVGTLTLTATYEGFSDSASVDVYQRSTAPVSITTNRTVFDLNYTATNTTKIFVKFKPHTGGCGMQGPASSDYKNAYICGRSYTGNNTQFSLNCFYNSTSASETKFRARYYAGNSYNDNYYTGLTTEQIYEATLSATGVTFNGKSTTFSSTFTSSNIYLGGGSDGLSNGYYGYGGIFTIYEFKIFENNVLVKNYVPWVNNNGYGCIKDTLTDTIVDAKTPSLVTANFE